MQQTTSELGAGPAAVLVRPSPQDAAADIVRALGLPPYQAVLAVLGTADDLAASLQAKLAQLLDRGVARAAREAGALLLASGAPTGLAALLGAGVASRGHQSALLGVVPAALVAYPGGPAGGAPLEPNHSHVVLAEGSTWGSEMGRFFQLLRALVAPGGRASGVPALGLLVGGGPAARGAVVQAVRQQLPLLVITGTGGLADELAAAWASHAAPLDDDAQLAEILADGTVSFYPLAGSVQGLERRLVRELGANLALQQAWETFADYDANANRQQKRFDALQQTLIGLGLVGTALAIAQQLYAPKEAGTSTLLPAPALWQAGLVGWWWLRHLLILIPIALTVLVTATNRFKQGTKWLLLRAGAEAIKRELYRYRTRAQYYADNAEQQLAERIEDITRRTMRTEVNSASLRPYDKRLGFPPGMGATEGADDGLSFLTPARYVEVRLGNQLAYFRRKAVRLEKQLKLLSWLTFIVGGVGTYLAAVGQQVWIALTTALVAAMGTYLGYRQTESTLTKYNQAATDLANVRAWWHALPSEQQTQQASLDLLVTHTEQVLQSEHDGWVQQMQNALAELHKNQAATAAERPAAPALPTAEAPAPAPAPTLASPPLAAAAAPAGTPDAAPTDTSDIAPNILESDPDEALTAEAELPTEDTTAEEEASQEALADPVPRLASMPRS